MKKTFLTIATLAAGLAAGAPAMAQDYRGHDRGYGYENTSRSDWHGDRDGWRGNGEFASLCNGNQADRLADQVRRAADRGAIDRRSAQDLFQKVNDTRRRVQNACSRRDRSAIHNEAVRLDHLEGRLRYLTSRGRNYGNRY